MNTVITHLGSDCKPAFLVTVSHMTVMLTSMGNAAQAPRAQGTGTSSNHAACAGCCGGW